MGSTSRYSDPYYDPTAPPLDLSVLMEEKYTEVVGLLKGFRWAEKIPRRLGGDATGPELSRDKKALRKLAHAYDLIVQRWASIGIELSLPEEDPSQRDKVFGAQVRLPIWIPRQLDKLEDDKVALGTAAIQMGDVRAANKVLGCLGQETVALARVRDYLSD